MYGSPNIRRILWQEKKKQRFLFHAELILLSEAMQDSHVLNAGQNLEDARIADIRAICINARAVDLKDRELNG